MKKILFLLFAGFCCMIYTANAQNAEFGIKGGLNVAGLHTTSDINLGSRASVYVGGFAHIHLNKKFAIQPELLYSCQGATQDYQNGSATWRLNYINLPILLQYMFDNGFRLETGPQLGLLASAKLKSGGTITNRKDDFTNGDFSWAFGVSYLTHSGFGVDARYNLGISNINNTGSTEKLQNRVFQAGIFYQFGH